MMWDSDATQSANAHENVSAYHHAMHGAHVHIGRYRVMRLLATGGMSRVYLAIDEQLGREVALKILTPGLAQDPVRIERFRLEARRVASLRHPNIVPLLDSGEEGDTFYLVMPFYPRALRELLESRRTVPLKDVVSIAAQMADALDYAHRQGLIHRDVKPENILLDEGGHALLTDFGIAKSAPQAPRNLATAGPLQAAEAGQQPIASIEYSAPEHLLGRPTEARSDVYSLGVVVYEMLTDRVPFPLSDGRVHEIIMRMLTEAPTPPSLFAPNLLPPALDAVVLRALEGDPRRRYATPGEFSAELSRVFAGSGPLTMEPSWEQPQQQPQPRSSTSIPTMPIPAPQSLPNSSAPRAPRPQVVAPSPSPSPSPESPPPTARPPKPLIAPPLSPQPPRTGPLRFWRRNS